MATYTESAPALWRFQCDPTPDGVCNVEAFFRSELVNDEDPADRLTKDAGSVTFRLPDALAVDLISLAHAADE